MFTYIHICKLTSDAKKINLFGKFAFSIACHVASGNLQLRRWQQRLLFSCYSNASTSKRIIKLHTLQRKTSSKTRLLNELLQWSKQVEVQGSVHCWLYEERCAFGKYWQICMYLRTYILVHMSKRNSAAMLLIQRKIYGDFYKKYYDK